MAKEIQNNFNYLAFYNQILFRMKHPLKYLLLIGILFIGLQVSAQFGVRLKYNSSDFPNFDKNFNIFPDNNTNVFGSGVEGGVDYWFKLKKRRIEFMPELAFSYASTSFKSQGLGLEKINLTGYHFNFHTNIYALDLEDDCNCPTFSKQGASFNKGLFFHFTPGLGYYTTKSTFDGQGTFENEIKDLVFRAGVGIGLDLGVSDLLTLTPILSYYFHSKMNWTDPPNGWIYEFPHIVSDNQKLLQLTLRLGFRPDYTSGRRYR